MFAENFISEEFHSWKFADFTLLNLFQNKVMNFVYSIDK